MEWIAALEVLVHPFRRGDSELAQQYRDILLNVDGMTTIPMSRDIAEEAARLRGIYNIRTPDAIQIATSLLEGASFFLTNDTRLASIPGLKVLILDKLKRECAAD